MSPGVKFRSPGVSRGVPRCPGVNRPTALIQASCQMPYSKHKPTFAFDFTFCYVDLIIQVIHHLKVIDQVRGIIQ